MPQTSPKGSLPYGWVVQTSKNYPDRIYYFNIFTGASSWECPELGPPRILSEEKSEKDTAMNNKSSETYKLNSEELFQNLEKISKPCTPPTAVVVPVVHEHKKTTALDSQKKSKKRKTCDLIENNNTPVVKKKKKKSKKKKISPLNEGGSCISYVGNDTNTVSLIKRKKSRKRKISNTEQTKDKSEVNDKSSSPVELKDQNDADLSLSSPVENSITDVEMHDVSMDLDDLREKKETVFDTSACYYIVVDTNVLIRELHLISELKDTPLDGCGPPHIFIPWVVIEELDRLKMSKNAKGAQRNAVEAIRYLNSVLSKHPRFHGQSPAEAEEWAKTYSKCNDDKILECCMALCDKMPAEKVILLTNDKNLVNKALICKINVHNFESMMKKVKPDTVFNYEEIKMSKKKKKEKCIEESKSSNSNATEEQFLQIKRDNYKREIHKIMSNARLLLKDVLYKFLKKEMFVAYGNAWLNFKIEVHLLKGILEAIKKYWRVVFYEFFSEKDKRNFELLLEKSSRPEGFLGDKDECLIILSAIEDVFREIQKRQSNLKVHIEQIQEYRVACVNAFIAYCEVESSIRPYEDKSIHSVLDTNWAAINQLCGFILDYYAVPHDLVYDKINQSLPDFEIRRIMSILYPGVHEFKRLLSRINEEMKKCKPINLPIQRLTKALLDFIPSLKLPHDPIKYPSFSRRAMERFFLCPQNRQAIEIGIDQINNFHRKLDEVLRVMALPHLRNKNPVAETMICD